MIEIKKFILKISSAVTVTFIIILSCFVFLYVFNFKINPSMIKTKVQTGFSKYIYEPLHKIKTPDTMKNLLLMNGNTVYELNKLGCSQLITVSSNGSNARIEFYILENNIWTLDDDMSCSGFVGKNGVTEDMHEGGNSSPKGLFHVGDAFYIHDKPSTGLFTFEITNDTYWVDDPNSIYYNKRVESTENKDWNSAEHMIDYHKAYEYGFVIDYNTEAICNAGSAIFFHISNSPTAGCVGTDRDSVIKYLSKLKSSSNPYILIV